MHVESETPTSNDGWLHWPGGRPDDWRNRPHRMPEPEPEPERDYALWDRAYRALLAACPLSDEHREWLADRGVAEDDAERLLYGTLPESEAARGAAYRAVLAAVGPVAGLVPGFTRRGIVANPDDGMPGGDEILHPFRDADGRVVGIQRRLANPANPTRRYRWLSEGQWDGVGSTIHHAMPRTMPTSPVWYFTEGPRKADVGADRLGQPVFACPGITNTRKAAAALARVEQGGYVAVAFDKEDTDEKRANVARAEQRLVDRIAEARPDITVLQALWHHHDGKGLDDLLLSGLTPFTIPHPMARQATAAPVADLAEVRRLREETRLITRIVAKNDLGGDVGGAAAIRLVNWAAAQAEQNGIEPGGVIPLVAKRIAAEYWDGTKGPIDPVTGRPAGEYVEAVARQTIGKRIDEFAAKGIIQTEPTHYTYIHKGQERRVDAPGLVWPEGGRLELLRRFAAGSVLEPGETRNRGGKREPRRPLVCPVCAGAEHPTAYSAQFSCTCCGTIYRSGEVHADHITLCDELADHPALLEQAAAAAADATAPDVEAGDDRIIWNDDGQGEQIHPALVEQGESSPHPTVDTPSRSTSLSGEVGARREAARLYGILTTHKKVEFSIRHGKLVFDESLLPPRLLRQVFDNERELTAYVREIHERRGDAPAEDRALVEQGELLPLIEADDDRGEAGADRWTA